MKQHYHTWAMQKDSRVKWIDGHKTGTGTVKQRLPGSSSCFAGDFIIIDDSTGAELSIPFQRLSSLGSKRRTKEEIFFGLTKTKKRKKGA
jgi:hypothetical protein